MKYLTVFFLIIFSTYSNEIKFENFNLPIFEEEKKLTSESLDSVPVVINFFASWCTACVVELPELRELKERNQNKFKFIAVNAGENPKTIKKFLNRYSFPYTILMDNNREYSKKIGVNELPHTLVVGREGNILYSGKVPPKQVQMEGYYGNSQ